VREGGREGGVSEYHPRVRENLVVTPPFERLVPKEMHLVEVAFRKVPREWVGGREGGGEGGREGGASKH